MLNHEKLLHLLNQSAITALGIFDEPLAIMSVIAWQPELGNDMPFGLMKTKSSEVITPALIVDCMKQTNKLQASLSATLTKLNESNKTQETKIHELEEEIRRLKSTGNNEAKESK